MNLTKLLNRSIQITFSTILFKDSRLPKISPYGSDQDSEWINSFDPKITDYYLWT